jgi:hypothetical protein
LPGVALNDPTLNPKREKIDETQRKKKNSEKRFFWSNHHPFLLVSSNKASIFLSQVWERKGRGRRGESGRTDECGGGLPFGGEKEVGRWGGGGGG